MCTPFPGAGVRTAWSGRGRYYASVSYTNVQYWCALYGFGFVDPMHVPRIAQKTRDVTIFSSGIQQYCSFKSSRLHFVVLELLRGNQQCFGICGICSAPAAKVHTFVCIYIYIYIYIWYGACVLGHFTLVGLPQVRSIVKHTERMDLFVLNFPTKWCNHYFDRTYSYCAIVVRLTVCRHLWNTNFSHASMPLWKLIKSSVFFIVCHYWGCVYNMQICGHLSKSLSFTL